MYSVVIIENEPVESKSLKGILSKCPENIRIYEAGTGESALMLIDRLSCIDIVLIDINISVPDGCQIVEYLRQKDSETKIIVVTANDDFHIIRYMLSLKVDDYLLKPVKSKLIIDSVLKNLCINYHDIVFRKALTKKISTMFETCDYTQWHHFIFNLIDGFNACQKGPFPYTNRLTEMLKIIIKRPELQSECLSDCRNKIEVIINFLNAHGLSRSYFGYIITTLIDISAELFEYILRHTEMKMDFISRAKFHIERNILNNMSLDEIAAKSFVSSCYLSRKFKKSTGTGLSNYITHRKISVAKSLLQYSDLKVNAIALELSWHDSNYFCRIFKKETGMAPSDYRRNVGNV
ncbi:helix-turn-helix domain-containing protein [Erwinia papayae]|uniref:Helix-turn-helix domain-containing protein n=1 Tax=Erwinia papayae TaxID=206499 RepID=A0ABV3N0E4_9GAMM